VTFLRLLGNRKVSLRLDLVTYVVWVFRRYVRPNWPTVEIIHLQLGPALAVELVRSVAWWKFATLVDSATRVGAVGGWCLYHRLTLCFAWLLACSRMGAPDVDAPCNVLYWGVVEVRLERRTKQFPIG